MRWRPGVRETGDSYTSRYDVAFCSMMRLMKLPRLLAIVM